MFCYLPKSVNKNVSGKNNKKRKKQSTQRVSDKKPRYMQQGGLNTSIAMSTWAQNYAAAATWQLKHQVAYWKSRAIALQYENNILHNMIRQECFQQSGNRSSTQSSQAEFDSTESEEDTDEEVDEDVNEHLEASEQWIKFLKDNAKYREDARRERELLRAKREAEAESEENVEMEKEETSEERKARLVDTYGDDWEKILCLETSTLCNFINACDRERPIYWPNIPLNFSNY